MKKNLPEKVYSNSYIEYADGIREIDKEKCLDISYADLLILMRTFFWYINEAGFQDIYDSSVEVYSIINNKNVENISSNYEYDIKLIKRFILEFHKGNYLDSVSSMIYSYNQIKSVLNDKISQNEIKCIERFISLFSVMQDTEYKCYYLLREIIREDHFTQLFKLLETLASEHLDFILHALDHFKGNKELITFYDAIIKNEEYDCIKDSVATYLSRIK